MMVSPLNVSHAPLLQTLAYSPEQPKGFHCVRVENGDTVVIGRALINHQAVGTVVSKSPVSPLRRKPHLRLLLTKNRRRRRVVCGGLRVSLPFRANDQPALGEASAIKAAI